MSIIEKAAGKLGAADPAPIPPTNRDSLIEGAFMPALRDLLWLPRRAAER